MFVDTAESLELLGMAAMSELKTLHAEVEGCTKCPRLVDWREEVAVKKRKAYREQDYWGKPVPGFGDHDADLMIVGLAPGAHGANRTGRIFTGDRSGDWLFRALHKAGFANQPNATDLDDGLELDNCYITMPVRCVPPQNKPTAGERNNCAPFLIKELDLIKPKVILCLGSIGLNAVTQIFEVSPRPKFTHGQTYEIDNAPVVMASYHVSQQNTQTGRLTEEMLDEVFANVRDRL